MIRGRLRELGLEQKNLAAAAEVIDWETVIALPVMEGMVGDHRHGDSETEDPMEVHDGIDEDG